jgi:uncharacterized protein
MTDDSSQQLVRITVDTNLLISGFIRSGTAPRRLLRAWLQGVVRLVMSAELHAEVVDVLQRPKFARYDFDTQLMADVLGALATSEPVEPLTEPDLPLRCRDPKDNMVLACALAARVDYIVTGDTDLLVLDGCPALGTIRVVTVRDFLLRIGIDPDGA